MTAENYEHSKLYTKTGDKGQTSLIEGSRVLKDDHRIELFGEVDELNSQIGFSLSLISLETNKLKELEKQSSVLEYIQHKLFAVGPFVTCPIEKRSTFNIASVSEKDILLLEKHIDVLDGQIPELKEFILPGGHLISSSLHLCRSVCRRGERRLVSYLKNQVSADHELELILTYMNRLSDYFFVLSRFVNIKLGGREVILSKDPIAL